jgi:uncharacterized membrane protein YfcA
MGFLIAFLAFLNGRDGGQFRYSACVAGAGVLFSLVMSYASVLAHSNLERMDWNKLGVIFLVYMLYASIGHGIGGWRRAHLNKADRLQAPADATPAQRL